MVGEPQVLLADVTVHVACICPLCPTHVTGTTSKMKFNGNVFLVKAFCVSTDALVYLDVLIVRAHMFYEQREGAEICGISFVLSEILRSQKLHLHVLLL